jgi:hypothetical protein
MTTPDRPTFVLLVQPLPPLAGEPPAHVRLRRLVKLLLRRDDLRLRLVSHREVPEGSRLTVTPPQLLHCTRCGRTAFRDPNEPLGGFWYADALPDGRHGWAGICRPCREEEADRE